MAISGDIEKLERRWTENPTGLMFAPLAEAYRKAGDPTRALEILEQGLSQHPEYIPALIVKGRCGLDSESLAEAEAAFQQALARDPVNPIALRGVAEVYERTGRPDLAIERLEVLLDVDRGDSDARDALARLRAASRPIDAPARAQFAAEPLPPAIEEPEVQEPVVEEPAPATAPS
ncbi:MAG: tetratricopeptide repeat protein, partial [Gemmatimonadota bacterium]